MGWVVLHGPLWRISFNLLNVLVYFEVLLIVVDDQWLSLARVLLTLVTESGEVLLLLSKSHLSQILLDGSLSAHIAIEFYLDLLGGRRYFINVVIILMMIVVIVVMGGLRRIIIR